MIQTFSAQTPFGDVALVPRVRERVSGREFHRKPRLHVWPSWDVFEALDEYPVRVWRRQAIVALAEAQFHVVTDGMTWNSRAGCSCGCSPGFVLQNVPAVVWGQTIEHFDVHLGLESAIELVLAVVPDLQREPAKV